MMHASQAESKKDRLIALAVSLFVGALVLFVLFIWDIITPIPPFPESPIALELEMGMMDLGTNSEGFGSVDNHGMGEGTGDQSNAAPVSGGEPQQNNDYVTSTDPSTQINTSSSDNPETRATPDPKPDSELDNALDLFKKNPGSGSGGDGNANQAGDLGDPNGHPDGGRFNGGGPGKGAGFSLKGRKMLRAPDRVSDSQEEGIVVVAIVVNADGKVIKAEPGEPGSTTSNAMLYMKARQAAMTARFNPSPEGVAEQRGTITFKFVLQ